VVFPEADFKFYLDATPAERARRRVAQLRARGEIVDYQEVLNQIMDRDRRDQSRTVGPLAIPVGAEVIDTTSLAQEQVIERITSKVQSGIRV
jgi:cytidylate kinase